MVAAPRLFFPEEMHKDVVAKQNSDATYAHNISVYNAWLEWYSGLSSRMHVHVHIFVRVCIHVRVCESGACMYIVTSIYIHVLTCMCKCIYAHKHAQCIHGTQDLCIYI